MTDPRKRTSRLREIPFGPSGDSDEICIYDNGHYDRAEFLAAVRAFTSSDVPQDVRDAATVDDVQHFRFRPMSPSEARSLGFDSGVQLTEDGGYPVTAVML